MRVLTGWLAVGVATFGMRRPARFVEGRQRAREARWAAGDTSPSWAAARDALGAAVARARGAR